MLLDVGVSSAIVTDEDFAEPSDELAYTDELDDIDSFLVEYSEDNNNETGVNFNDDVTKVPINEILNEMRMGSPIQDDFNPLRDEANNNTVPKGDGGLEGSTNQNPCCSKTLNQNDDLKEPNHEETTTFATNNDELNQFLNSDVCSFLELQVDIIETVSFNYDVSEQLNVTLSYPEEPENANEDNSTLNVNVKVENNDDTKDQQCVEYESYLQKAVEPADEPVSDSITYNDANTCDKKYYACSTALPMTAEELQTDIRRYLITEQNTSFYEDRPVTSDSADKQERKESPFNTKMLPDLTSAQNLQLELDSVNQVVSFEAPNMQFTELGTADENQTPAAAVENYQCSYCSFCTDNMQAINVHMHVHPGANFSCADCELSLLRQCQSHGLQNLKQRQTPGLQNFRQHQSYDLLGAAYFCQTCDYVTYSSSKIRSHMRREHEH